MHHSWRVRRSLVHPGALALVCSLVALPHPGMADEGMWELTDLPAYAERLEEYGLQISPSVLADLEEGPLGAVVSLGGCSGSFVSDDGLVITNHHCLWGALQYASGEGENLFRDGFLAESLDEERWIGPTAVVRVLQGLEDVTEEVAAGTYDLEPLERFRVRDQRRKALISACEESGDVRCSISSFDGGARYMLQRMLELRDVRLVYAPPESIGLYGGDEDNWRWPRHTGDFAMLRAWADPEGRPAAHGEENRPFQPAQHLRVARQPLVTGDLVMVAGYPGSTFRHRTKSEIERAVWDIYPRRIARYGAFVDVLEAAAAGRERAELAIRPRTGGLRNAMAYMQGILDGVEAGGLLERRAAIEEEASAGLMAVGDHGALEAWSRLELVLQESEADDELSELLRWILGSSHALQAAATAEWWAWESSLPDEEREAGFQERDREQVRQRVARLERSFDAAVDEAALGWWLAEAAGDDPVLVGLWLEELLTLHEGDAAAAAAALIGTSRLQDHEERMALLDRDLEALHSDPDPLLRLARAINTQRRALRTRAHERRGHHQAYRPRWIEAMRAHGGAPAYADANGTFRITWGRVQGYPREDGGWWTPWTPMGELADRERGESPFASPPTLLEALHLGPQSPWASERLGDVPINFLSDLDTTGGNSGSPTLNEQGELVGLLFDGNYEAMASDWVFDPVRTRSIHVDIRYMLFVLETLHPGNWLLEQLVGENR